jgi:O-antigen ligase
MFENLSLDKTYQFLLIILAFLMPLTVFGANSIIVIICLLWLFSGNYRTKMSETINNKFLLASIFFFLLHVVGLIWTEDLSWGLHIVHKMWYFLLLLPVLMSIVRKDYIYLYIFAFLAAIALTEIVSYLVWFEVINPFKNATIVNPTPFMSHVSYNPILVFAIYLVLHELFFNKKMKNLAFAFYSFFAIIMVFNMFITGGRAGQVTFFVMLSIIIFQVLDKQRFKSLLAIFIIIPIIFLSAYQISDLFQKRVNIGVYEAVSFSETKGYDEEGFSPTSVGSRIAFAMNSWQVILKNPILGVGTGDFPQEYKKINQINTPRLPNATNPHNMYVLILVQLGSVGLLSMLTIFYFQIKISFNTPNKFRRDLGITLPLLFIVMMLGDSYLLGHYTSLMFVFFSSFLYKDFEKN